MSEQVRLTVSESQTPTRETEQKSAGGVEATVEAIEQAVGQIGQNLTEITRRASRRSRAGWRAVKEELMQTMAALRSCPELEKIKDHPVSVYWRHRSVCGPELAGKRVGDFLQIEAAKLWSTKGVGRVRIEGLIEALKYAMSSKPERSNSEVETAKRPFPGATNEWEAQLPETAKDEVRELLSLGSGDVPPIILVGRQLVRHIGFENMVLLWMSRNVFHRRVAEQLGVTESRVSQILKEKLGQFKRVLITEMPEMTAQWDQLLSEPAVPEETLIRGWFDGLSSEKCHQLAEFMLVTYGATHPVLACGDVADCWCLDEAALKNFARDIAALLPKSDEELRQYLGHHAPHMSLYALGKAFGRSVTHVKNPGIWFSSRKEAVDYVLAHAGRPLTRTELAQALGVRASQTKALLLSHGGLERIGPNLKRVYTLKNG